MNIQLHIERLVLDGLPVEAAQGPAVRAALEGELTRLLAEGGLGSGFEQDGAVAYARGADLRLPSSPGPAQLGREIGAAVHRSLVP